MFKERVTWLNYLNLLFLLKTDKNQNSSLCSLIVYIFIKLVLNAQLEDV